MRQQIAWTAREEDGVKREVRVSSRSGVLKWQSKRADAERWEYEAPPTAADLAMLEELLTRRGQRGRNLDMLELVRRLRGRARG